MCIPWFPSDKLWEFWRSDSAHPDAFRESELQSLESVADICATAIQNAHYVERVKQLAYLDGLTGIFNRRFFELRFTEEIERSRRYGTGMAVIMADIDQFKRLNDEFGHVLGDEVLRQVSSLFHQQLRKIDVVCRYGGEEFGIVLTQTDASHAVSVAEKLRRMVGRLAVPRSAPDGHDQRRSRRISRPWHLPRRFSEGRGLLLYTPPSRPAGTKSAPVRATPPEQKSALASWPGKIIPGH